MILLVKIYMRKNRDTLEKLRIKILEDKQKMIIPVFMCRFFECFCLYCKLNYMSNMVWRNGGIL